MNTEQSIATHFVRIETCKREDEGFVMQGVLDNPGKAAAVLADIAQDGYVVIQSMVDDEAFTVEGSVISAKAGTEPEQIVVHVTPVDRSLDRGFHAPAVMIVGMLNSLFVKYRQ